MIDLRNVELLSVNLSFDNIENEMDGNVEFIESEDFLARNTIANELIFRVPHRKDEYTIEEVNCKSYTMISFGWTKEIGNKKGMVKWLIEFTTHNANINIMHLFRSKEGKEMIVTQQVAELVKKHCNPRKLPFEELEKVVLACTI